MPETVVASYLPEFENDLEEILSWSEDQFGSDATDRYDALIRQALGDLKADPRRPGSKARLDIADHAYVYHLKSSRERVAGDRVKNPRHFVMYRLLGNTLEFARLLHDSCDLALHLPASLEDV